MKKNERCLAILEILQKQHKVTVTELAEKFDISEMTVRRDLNSLAREYNISRTHGGAELGNQPVVRMISFDEPRIAHKDSKDKIAALAATMIQNGQRIFIDAGSTTRIILNYLEEDTRAVVVTHHLAVAEQALKFENHAGRRYDPDYKLQFRTSSRRAVKEISVGYCIYWGCGNWIRWEII